MHHGDHGDPEPDQKEKLSMIPFLDHHYHSKPSDPGLLFLPFPEPKKQSISTLEREWDTQSVELGTSPSCGGLRSVVRTRHQPGRSLGRSNSSTVWPGEKSRQLAYRVEPSDNLTVMVLGDIF